jgi:uracil-DNA glycosylase
MEKKSRLRIVEDEPEVDNSWTIEEIAEKHPPRGWKKVFKSCKDELKSISDLLEERNRTHGHFTPNKCDLFNAFRLTPLKKVRVCLIGMDPYQNLYTDGVTVATGTSFSTRKGRPIQPSTMNIYKELQRNIPGFKIPKHGDLTAWTEQGVFLLNVCLTTEIGISGAHSKYLIWMPFITKVLDAIQTHNPHCIFLLWGRDAQKLKSSLGGKAVVLEASHPSPYSVDKGENPFKGCRHFYQINQMLNPETAEKAKKSDPFPWPVLEGPIDWSLSDS